MAVKRGDTRDGSTERNNWFARHPVAAFIVLAFVLSWWVWPFALVNPDSVAILSFGPLIAAVVVAALAGGRGRVMTLLRSVVRWRVHWSWYVFAIAGPMLIAAVTGATVIGLGIVETSQPGEEFGWSTWSGLPLLFLATGLVGGPLFEEPGWRGFLLPELERRHTALRSTVVVAVLWSLWHLPLLISEPTDQRPPLPFVVWILAQAVLLTWLYNSTGGSVLMAILFHTAANTANRILLEPFLGADGFTATWWVMAALYSLAAALAIWWTHGQLGQDTADMRSGPSRSWPITHRPPATT
jgi:hypothetical protein